MENQWIPIGNVEALDLSDEYDVVACVNALHGAALELGHRSGEDRCPASSLDKLELSKLVCSRRGELTSKILLLRTQDVDCEVARRGKLEWSPTCLDTTVRVADPSRPK